MADLTLGGGVVVVVAAPTQPVITMAPPAPSPVLVVPVVGAPSTVPGDDGNGIVSIVRTDGDGSQGSVDTYTITYDDTTTSTFQVTNGADGDDGDDGDPNILTVGAVSTLPTGQPATFTITGVSPSQTVDVGLPRGEPGADSIVPGPAGNGVASITRTSGDGSAGSQDTYTITFTDASTTTFAVTNGDNGEDSTVPGPPGPANTLAIGTVTSGPADATITGTAPAQTLNLTLQKGADGADSTVPGPPGDDGISPPLQFAVVNHGATAGTARPTADAVYWIGSVEPTNMADYDMWAQ